MSRRRALQGWDRLRALYLQNNGCHFRRILFPEKGGNSYSDWSVWLNLSCRTYSPWRTNEALAFLKGTQPAKHSTLREFALFYPFAGSQYNRIEERHSARGVGIKIWPGEWYE